MSICAKHSPSKLIALPENGEISTSAPALEQIQVEEMLANQKLNKDDFSLLGKTAVIISPSSITKAMNRESG